MLHPLASEPLDKFVAVGPAIKPDQQPFPGPMVPRAGMPLPAGET